NNRGISVAMSSNSTISCNQVENMSECLFIWGFNFESRVALNEFEDGNYGLYLVSPVFIGTQSHTANQWLGEYAEYGAYIEGDNPVVTADMSTFLVDPVDNTDFLPGTIGPVSVDEDNWLQSQEGPLGYACIGNPPVPADV